MTPLERLVEAAKVWANYQDTDSLLDQKTDTRVRVQAETARQMLLYAIDNLLEGAEEVRPTTQTD